MIRVMEKAKISEIFSSIQGEGIYAGERQLFIRFYGCNLSSCQFCDTKPSVYREYSAQELLDKVLSFKKGYHSISITGGEALLQSAFLRGFLPELKRIGKKIYLETNGTLPGALKEIIDFIDIVAMDFKLPSSTGLNDFWQAHKIFIKEALVKKVFVKSVITAGTTEDDIEKMCDIIAKVDSNITLVLQPVTPIDGIKGPGTEKLIDFQRIYFDKLKTVKIIPQLHKLAGVR